MTIDDHIITTEYENEQQQCEHQLATYHGWQEGTPQKKGFPLGNCIQCDSTIDISKYGHTGRKIGEKGLYLKKYQPQKKDWLHQRMTRRT